MHWQGGTTYVLSSFARREFGIRERDAEKEERRCCAALSRLLPFSLIRERADISSLSSSSGVLACADRRTRYSASRVPLFSVFLSLSLSHRRRLRFGSAYIHTRVLFYISELRPLFHARAVPLVCERRGAISRGKRFSRLALCLSRNDDPPTVR